jgi:anti-anti-sigma factor
MSISSQNRFGFRIVDRVPFEPDAVSASGKSRHMKLEPWMTEASVARTIVVKGDLDLDSSQALHDRIQGALEGIRKLRIDLSNVGFIDSWGIAVLIVGYRLCLRAHVEFCLIDPSPQVKAVIELGELHKLIPIAI